MPRLPVCARTGMMSAGVRAASAAIGAAIGVPSMRRRRHHRAIRVPAPAAHLTESMSLRAFRTLVAIARYRTFARAGEAIGLTQSAVSLQIKALESEYNVQLFDRSRRQPVLTEAGNILVAQAEQVLAMVDRIPDALSDEKKLVGRLRVGAIQTALSGPLPDALLALRDAHPSLRVHVSAGMSAELANASRPANSTRRSRPAWCARIRRN